MTSPPAITSRKVAATPTFDSIAVQSVRMEGSRVATAAATAATPATTTIEPGIHHSADGRTPTASCELSRLPSTSMLTTEAVTPAARPTVHPPTRRPATIPHPATAASSRTSSNQLGAITAGRRQTYATAHMVTTIAKPKPRVRLGEP